MEEEATPTTSTFPTKVRRMRSLSTSALFVDDGDDSESATSTDLASNSNSNSNVNVNCESAESSASSLLPLADSLHDMFVRGENASAYVSVRGRREEREESPQRVPTSSVPSTVPRPPSITPSTPTASSATTTTTTTTNTNTITANSTTGSLRDRVRRTTDKEPLYLIQRTASQVRSQSLLPLTPTLPPSPSPALAPASLIPATPTISHHPNITLTPIQTPIAVPAQPLPQFAPLRTYRMWDYIKGQLLSSEYSNDNPDYMNAKKERIENFLAVPLEFEKLMFLGYLICLDSFLYVFTILPARILIALGTIFKSVFFRASRLSTSQKCDLMKGLLVAICCYMLENVDGSRLYHSVRGQSTIKLYVIFNLLEICDKLCSAFGHDVLDSLFSRTSSSTTPALSLRRINRVTHFSLALLYVFVHSMVLFYQVMALNVAINSYNNALLSLLLSNQFIEIKGSVFKKFERENLFQLSCSDIVERFQLSVFLVIISVRNLVELTGATATTAASYSPFFGLTFTGTLNTLLNVIITASDKFIHIITTETPQHFFHTLFTTTLPTALESVTTTIQSLLPTLTSLDVWLTDLLTHPSSDMVQTLLYPVLAVLGTELLVDWLKHAFITKFNQLKVSVVYKKYRETLCRDLIMGEMDGAAGEASTVASSGYVDKSPSVARRIGFVSVPLACLVVRVVVQTVRMLCLGEQECWKAGDAGGGAGWNLEWFGFGVYDSMTWFVGEVSTCVVGNGEWQCFEDVFGHLWSERETVKVWVLERGAVVAGVLGKLLGLYFVLLAIKLVVGFNLIKMARRRMHESAVSAAANSIATAQPPPLYPTDPSAVNNINNASYNNTSIPSTPTGRLRKGSGVSLVDLEKQLLLQQQQQQQSQAQASQQPPSSADRGSRRGSHMTRVGSVSSGGGGGGSAPIADMPGLPPVAGAVAIGDDRYGAFVPFHVNNVEKDPGLVMVGGVGFVPKDDKLDRVDRFAMVKSRIV
ncbi:hypothetical protein HDU79_006931 [Rhizoclosmatium sp. JEL0117]|nr:hypothetical protein HDU79_006931 [Rhizoclosmatium sp. JEL0117]